MNDLCCIKFYLRMAVILFFFLSGSLSASADQSKQDFTSSFVTVEDNLNTMDKDRDGIVTVYEVRAYIESIHGKNYKKDVMDDMESSANGKSCSTPFAKSLYQ